MQWKESAQPNASSHFLRIREERVKSNCSTLTESSHNDTLDRDPCSNLLRHDSFQSIRRCDDPLLVLIRIEAQRLYIKTRGHLHTEIQRNWGGGCMWTNDLDVTGTYFAEHLQPSVTCVTQTVQEDERGRMFARRCVFCGM